MPFSAHLDDARNGSKTSSLRETNTISERFGMFSSYVRNHIVRQRARVRDKSACAHASEQKVRQPHPNHIRADFMRVSFRTKPRGRSSTRRRATRGAGMVSHIDEIKNT